MQIHTFLAALPALLGFAGFVIYRTLAANKAGDGVSRRIIEKLRSEGSGGVSFDRRLTPKQVERLLEHEQHLRNVVGEHDFRLLRQALTQQFVINILVYVLTFGFCALSVYLFVKPPQTNARPVSVNQPSPTQTSNGQNSPNVMSNGSGAVTITIPDQSKTASAPKGEDAKK